MACLAICWPASCQSGWRYFCECRRDPQEFQWHSTWVCSRFLFRCASKFEWLRNTLFLHYQFFPQSRRRRCSTPSSASRTCRPRSTRGPAQCFCGAFMSEWHTPFRPACVDSYWTILLSILVFWCTSELKEGLEYSSWIMKQRQF